MKSRTDSSVLVTAGSDGCAAGVTHSLCPAFPSSCGLKQGRTTELWVVVFVSADVAGVTVVCELHDGNDRHARNAA